MLDASTISSLRRYKTLKKIEKACIKPLDMPSISFDVIQ